MYYSISDLERLSGVHVHTIRIWERRYHALEPLRSAGNTRFYDDHQLRRLLNIVSLSQSGLKISQVCALSEAEMDNLLKLEIDKTISDDAHFEYYISRLLNFGLVYDEFKFDELMSACIAEYGMVVSYKRVIYPLLTRLGLMWRIDHICPAQEHFLSNLIRQKLFAAIHALPVSPNMKASWLLFLPEDEEHDIGLLLANYLLRAAGQKVIFLGGRVPLESVKDAMQNNEVAHMLLFMVRSRPLPDAESYLTELSNTFSNARIHLAGNTKLIGELHLAENINWFHSIAELEETIKNIQHVN